MSTSTKAWLKGLSAAVLSAFGLALNGVIALPDVFNFTHDGLMNTLKLILVPTIGAAGLYLKQSPLPSDSVTISAEKTVSVTKND